MTKYRTRERSALNPKPDDSGEDAEPEDTGGEESGEGEDAESDKLERKPIPQIFHRRDRSMMRMLQDPTRLRIEFRLQID